MMMRLLKNAVNKRCTRARASGGGLNEVDSDTNADADADDAKFKNEDLEQRPPAPGPDPEPYQEQYLHFTTEARDEILFRQPETTHLGECPICYLPLPIDPFKSTLQSCCSHVICKACFSANKRREVNKKLRHTCPMCRQRLPKTDKEIDANSMKRVAANDPIAIQETGKKHYHEGSYRVAFDLWMRAADLGNVDAHYLLSLFYRDGRGICKSEKMEWYHLEEAAIAGHVGARFTLAYYENARRGRLDRAVKHLIIATSLGCDLSLRELKSCHADGNVDDEKFTAALHAHELAVDAMRSPQREEQARYENACEEWFCAGK